VTGRNAAGLDAVDRRLRDRVGVFAEIVFDVVFSLANLVSPDRASILKMNDVGARRQRRQ
jgi:hypothetical protein